MYWETARWMGTPEGCCSWGYFYVGREVVWLGGDASVPPSQKHTLQNVNTAAVLCVLFS